LKIEIEKKEKYGNQRNFALKDHFQMEFTAC